ncbi:MAG: hypothetical protein EB168_07370 [Euryarchaeota archaeon]|nr:hypothetical protein [Euryarchaeota archaeon]
MKLTFAVHIQEPSQGFDMDVLNEIVDDLKNHLDSGDPVGGLPKSFLISRVECTSISSDDEDD